MRKMTGLMAVSVILSVFQLAPAYAAMEMKHDGGRGMAMHHQHIMLNHALGMALEGSNLVMLGQMDMAEGIDELSEEHGRMMMKNARKLYGEVMSGKSMMKMHEGGKMPADDPMMKFTHELGDAQLRVMDTLKKMLAKSHWDHGMAMHHQHIMLNHALGMSLEGSNLIMLGQMGMAEGMDESSIEHGKMMMKNARKLYGEVMSGKAMMKMHEGGKMPAKDAAMKFTHELGDAHLNVMDKLEKMPAMNK